MAHRAAAFVPLLFFLLFLITVPCCSCRNLPSSPHESRQQDLHLLITIKTTRHNHGTRVQEALATWAMPRHRPTGARILFVTDSAVGGAVANNMDGLELNNNNSNSNLALLNSGCAVGHQNEALCCKMAFELQLAFAQQPDFWCHFDDDSFVLLHNLVALLRQFPPAADLYLGRPSTAGPISLPGDDVPLHHLLSAQNTTTMFMGGKKFRFGTGGAGICVSRFTLRKLHSLLLLLLHNGNQQQFEWFCDKLGVPDDVAIGFLLNNLLGIKLTNSEHLHSHLERLALIPRHSLANQISLSAAVYPSANMAENNHVNVPEYLPPSKDPMRFRSLQKFLDDDFRQKNPLEKMTDR